MVCQYPIPFSSLVQQAYHFRLAGGLPASSGAYCKYFTFAIAAIAAIAAFAEFAEFSAILFSDRREHFVAVTLKAWRNWQKMGL